MLPGINLKPICRQRSFHPRCLTCRHKYFRPNCLVYRYRSFRLTGRNVETRYNWWLMMVHISIIKWSTFKNIKCKKSKFLHVINGYIQNLLHLTKGERLTHFIVVTSMTNKFSQVIGQVVAKIQWRNSPIITDWTNPALSVLFSVYMYSMCIFN